MIFSIKFMFFLYDFIFIKTRLHNVSFRFIKFTLAKLNKHTINESIHGLSNIKFWQQLFLAENVLKYIQAFGEK